MKLSSIVYISVFACIEICLVLDGASQLVQADGHGQLYTKMQKAAGAFGFIASMLGYYVTAHYLCEDSLGLKLPMGATTSRFKSRESDTESGKDD